MKLEIVSVTRSDEKTFWAQSALGLSLRRLAFDRRVGYTVSFNNRSALAETFNARIATTEAADILVFAHDDICPARSRTERCLSGRRARMGANVRDVHRKVGRLIPPRALGRKIRRSE